MVIMSEKNIEIPDLADRIGVDERHVRRIINGERNFSVSEIYRFSIGLGVQPKELFDFEISLKDEYIPPIKKP
ncbi:helix-turn-helix transcriptional regulator [Indibacter alkaliphilus]